MNRMPKIEEIGEDYTLPQGALCLSKNGWLPVLEEVQIQMDPGMKLDEALKIIWKQHEGLLGEGDLIFKAKGQDPLYRGFIVFEPADPV